MPAGNMSTPNFKEACQKFVDAGISPQFLVPVLPPTAVISRSSAIEDKVRGKAPGRYVGNGEWAGLGLDILTRGVSRQETAKFATWPTGNVGVMGAAYPGIDSDAESAAMADLVEATIRETFGTLDPAVRLRGDNHRRVYSFRARDWQNDPVRTRHIHAELHGVQSGIDIIGVGHQYLVAGTHPSGDRYEWQKADGLDEREVVAELQEYRIDNADIERFIEIFERRLRKAGGAVISKGRTGVPGAEYDPEENNPTFSIDNIFNGLDRLPNNDTNFRDRSDLITAVAAIRAAAGRDGASQDFEDRVRDWACADETWCPVEYFDKIWDSLRRVRVSGDALDGLFRRNKIFIDQGRHFDDRAPEVSRDIKEHKQRAGRERLSDAVLKAASRYVFGEVNTREDSSSAEMREGFDPFRSWDGVDWWEGNTSQPDIDLVNELNAEFGAKKGGFWKFMRIVREHRPDALFYAETRNPNFPIGHIVKQPHPESGLPINLINLRAQSPTIRAADKADKDPVQSAKDVKTFLQFGAAIFGKLWYYELDTLAFMAQKRRRPGHMLFLVGDSGVGKSTYIQFLTKIFNGSVTDGIVDGTKLTTEGAARFAFANVEGSRIISIRELPKGGRRNAAILQQATSTIKQMVDYGPEGDYFTIEDKSTKARMVQNFARIVATSNHADAVEIEENDRRIFMVMSGIDLTNKPDEDYYETLIDILSDVDRLAAVYRYLLTHDISDYNPAAAPPASFAKAEQQTLRTQAPAERHMRAALAALEAHGRTAFDAIELAEIMSDMSEIEADYLGNGDKPVDYVAMRRHESMAVRGEFGRGIQRISKFVDICDPTRTTKHRDPAVYVLKGNKELLTKLNVDDRDDRLDYIDAEARRGYAPVHPWVQFRKGGV